MGNKKLYLDDFFDLNGWWTGGITYTSELTDEELEDLASDPDSNITPEIRSALISGYDCGTIETGYGDIGWDATFNCNLEDKEVDFWSLSDYTREWIIDKALDGDCQGDFFEDKTNEYELTLGELQYSPEKGSISTDVHIENITEDMEYDCQMSYDDINGIKFTLDNLNDDVKYLLDNNMTEIRDTFEPEMKRSLAAFEKAQASQKKHSRGC